MHPFGKLNPRLLLGAWRWPLLSAAAVVLSILLPLLLAGRDSWAIRTTLGGANQPFELFGLAVSVFAVGYLVDQARRLRRDPSWERALPVAAVLLALHYLPYFVNHSQPSWDFRCYTAAAGDLLAGSNPYEFGQSQTWYLYPPLLAQALARLHGWLASAAPATPDGLDPWWLVFYVWQCCQFYLLLLAMLLSVRLTRQCRIPGPQALVLVSVLFLVDSPLWRTLRGNQTNLFILDGVLLALLWSRSRPVLAGGMAALACQVKFQTAFFPVAWLVTRRYRAVLGFVGAFALLVLIQAHGGWDFTAWRQFAAFAVSSPPPVENDFFRNSSFFALAANLAGLFRLADPRIFVAVAVWVIRAAFAGWLALRFLGRERWYRSLISGASAAEADRIEGNFRLFGHTMDFLTGALLFSPLVWEHHFVLLIPVVIWRFGFERGAPSAGLVLAVLLILAPTTFDVFPLSLNKLVGTLLLLGQTSPGLLGRLEIAARSGLHSP